jgi:hypothetical protein
MFKISNFFIRNNQTLLPAFLLLPIAGYAQTGNDKLIADRIDDLKLHTIIQEEESNRLKTEFILN